MSIAPCEKDLLAPKQIIEMEEASSDNLGSYFDVTLVPTLTPASPAKEAADEEKNLSNFQVRNKYDVTLVPTLTPASPAKEAANEEKNPPDFQVRKESIYTSLGIEERDCNRELT
jgi:hypothetical protein